MYVYSLNDLYVMFREAETGLEKVSLLREWSKLNLPYKINWVACLAPWEKSCGAALAQID